MQFYFPLEKQRYRLTKDIEINVDDGYWYNRRPQDKVIFLPIGTIFTVRGAAKNTMRLYITSKVNPREIAGLNFIISAELLQKFEFVIN